MAPRIPDIGSRWGEMSASRPGHFNPGKGAPGTLRIGGCMNTRALEKT